MVVGGEFFFLGCAAEWKTLEAILQKSRKMVLDLQILTRESKGWIKLVLIVCSPACAPCTVRVP